MWLNLFFLYLYFSGIFIKQLRKSKDNENLQVFARHFCQNKRKIYNILSNKRTNEHLEWINPAASLCTFRSSIVEDSVIKTSTFSSSRPRPLSLLRLQTKFTKSLSPQAREGLNKINPPPLGQRKESRPHRCLMFQRGEGEGWGPSDRFIRANRFHYLDSLVNLEQYFLLLEKPLLNL